ncbi:MAG: MarR family transcriptional regulator [Parvularculaceae bacterium]
MSAEVKLNLSAFAPYRINVLARLMSEQLGAAYANEGLTISEWRVLAVVSQEHKMAARDVVARTPMDKMAVSRAVASLEARGLLCRAPGADRRVFHLRLSDAGKRIFARIADVAREYEAGALSCLSEDERATFFDMIERVEARLTGRESAGD